MTEVGRTKLVNDDVETPGVSYDSAIDSPSEELSHHPKESDCHHLRGHHVCDSHQTKPNPASESRMMRRAQPADAVSVCSPGSSLLMTQHHHHPHQLVLCSSSSRLEASTTPSPVSPPPSAWRVHPTTTTSITTNPSSCRPRSTSTAATILRSSRSFTGFDSKLPILANSSSGCIVCCISSNITTTTSSSTTTTSAAASTEKHPQISLRPNVTVTRRKSASERLAESKSRYIRSGQFGRDSTPVASHCTTRQLKDDDNNLDVSSNTATMSNVKVCEQQQHAPRETLSPSTRSSSSSRTSSFGFQQQQQLCCSPLVQSHPNLADKINIELNRSRLPQLNTSFTSTSSHKKRVSPRLSEGSYHAGPNSTNLELQLRELIGADTSAVCSKANSGDSSKNSKQARSHEELQKEANDIYRAELKFIASSCESLSSMYDSEPRHSLSPIDHNKNDSSDYTDSYNMVTEHSGTLGDHCVASAISKCSLAPPEEETDGEHVKSAIVRCKSDTAGEKEKPDRFASRSDKGRGLPASNYDADGENESYQKPVDGNDKCGTTEDGHGDEYASRPAQASSSFSSSSSRDLSSLSSSQMSLDDGVHAASLNHSYLSHHHSKSTSKLTFENLMLHQQSLMPSRSCHNLVSNFQTGPSVVERNARIIKWLFNCRKAMLQTAPQHAIATIR